MRSCKYGSGLARPIASGNSRRTSGSTMIGVLTALLLAGTLMIGVADFATILDKHQKQSELKAGTQELESLIRYALKYPTTCNTSVQDTPLNFDQFNISPFEMTIGGQTIRSGTPLQNGAKVLALQLENPVEVESNYYKSTLRLITTENRHENDQRFLDAKGIDYDGRKRNVTMPFFFVAESDLSKVDGCISVGEVVSGEDPKFAPDLGKKLCQLYAQTADRNLFDYNKDATPNCIINRFTNGRTLNGYLWGDASSLATGIQLTSNDLEISGPVIIDHAIERIPRFRGENLGRRYKACFSNGEGCPAKTSPKGVCTNYKFEVIGITTDEWEALGHSGHTVSNLSRSVSCQIPGERVYGSKIEFTRFNATNGIYMAARVLSKEVRGDTLEFTVDWFNPLQKAMVDLKCCMGAS